MGNSNQAPYELEFRKFENLTAKGDYRRAYDLFWDSPGILFWMTSVDVTWNVVQALEKGLDLDRGLSLYDSAKEFSISLERISQINGLAALVEKCEFAGDDKDGTNYWQRYNEFLAQVKSGNIRKIPENTFVYNYIPLGVSAKAYHLLTGEEQSNFERLIREDMDEVGGLILTDAFIKAAIKFGGNRYLPPNLWDL